MARAERDLEETSSDVDGARKEAKRFAADAEAKLAEIKLLEFDIAKSTITAPYDGAVYSLQRHVGEFVSRGEPILELYRLDKLSGVLLLDVAQVPGQCPLRSPTRRTNQSFRPARSANFAK